ncbi:hypothetical protein B0H19DRAFT_1386690 [Mycena capillaripes]|nr:hypothetical protein B0H19DRAFT_1386690 [Mycena capillaripes]
MQEVRTAEYLASYCVTGCQSPLSSVPRRGRRARCPGPAFTLNIPPSTSGTECQYLVTGVARGAITELTCLPFPQTFTGAVTVSTGSERESLRASRRWRMMGIAVMSVHHPTLVTYSTLPIAFFTVNFPFGESARADRRIRPRGDWPFQLPIYRSPTISLNAKQAASYCVTTAGSYSLSRLFDEDGGSSASL